MNNTTENPPKKGFPKILVILGIAIGSVLALIIAALSIVIYASRPITVEVGSDFSLSRIKDNKIISAVCSVDEKTAIDTSDWGDHILRLKFFGFLSRDLHVFVRDTTPPSAEIYNVRASYGALLSAKDFVKSITDVSETTVRFDGNVPDTKSTGKTVVSVRITDSSGNFTVETADLEITDDSTVVHVELGDDSLTDNIEEIFPDEEFDVSEVDITSVGAYTVRSTDNDVCRIISVIVEDTIPPRGKPVNLTVRKGESVLAKDLVKFLYDITDITVKFDGDPDFSEIGTHNVGIILEDESGNVTNLISQVEVCEIPSEVTVEYGFSLEDLQKAIFGSMSAEDYSVSFANDVSHEDLGVGTHEVSLIGDKDSFTVMLTVEDTTPPELVLKNISVSVGKAVSPKDFVDSCTDISEVEYSFEAAPSTDAAGECSVTVIATDAYGNSSSATAQLTVLTDATPPVIYGIKDLSIIYPTNISYVRGVYAVDDTDGNVEVVVDSSAVNVAVNGVYTVKYTATDKAGNVTELWANVTVNIADNTQVNSEPAVTDSPQNDEKPDTTPPVIYGVKDLSIVSPNNISYVRGVSAIDETDGNVEVVVDSSAVDISVNGVYTVKYTATDKAGNKAELSANVTVNIVTPADSANSAADMILSSIINDSMSQREKAWTIYSWVTSNLKYSTSTSHLMGQFYEGASSGFTIRRGNCYIYYAVTSVLLTRAGIENIEIQRNDPANPHYWNLVKMDGAWYHLDTCPHFAGHKKTVFLWTDAQVNAYSQDEVSGYYSFNPALYPATP